MIVKLEYDSLVKRLNPATVAVFALALLVPAAQAQLNGGPPSVTSNGFGGSTGPRGVPPTVTSPRFATQNNRPAAVPSGLTGVGFPRSNSGFTSHPSPKPPHHQGHDGDHQRHDGDRDHHPRGGAVYAVPYYYPYAYDAGESYSAQDAMEEDPDEYQGGPTIFDRRGPGTRPAAENNYSGPATVEPAAVAKETRASEDELISNQPPTLLVFKDGHQLEVANYAIMGATLFDLSGGSRHRILLSELNIEATVKENDDRGIDFRIPPGYESN